MENKSRRKGIKKRYKRIMATVAGAAVISSTMLTGMPVAKAQASPSSTHNINISESDIITRHDNSLVQIVKNNAGRFGFNTSTDSFTLLSNSGRKAIVRVRSNGQTFKVDLYQKNGTWEITTIRGIGDMNHPATYTPASMFRLQNYVTSAPTLGISQQILYQTNNYNDWLWNEGKYPSDMALGVLLQNPSLTGTSGLIPENVVKQLTNFDFSRQLVLFAHLGSVSPKGYGIGIAQVARTGNDLTVVVRTKSPLAYTKLAPTQTDDLAAIDLTNLDFRNPIRVTFVDQNGTVLSKYTISERGTILSSIIGRVLQH